jgi:anhydro-N-acetylmuramic acid kinase
LSGDQNNQQSTVEGKNLLVIGLISGTSVDGIDTALVEIGGTVESPQVQLLAGETYPYSPRLRETILQVCGRESYLLKL